MSDARQSHLSQQQIPRNNFWIFCSRMFALDPYKFELVSYHCQSMSYKLRPVSYNLCQGYEELYLVEKPPHKEKPLKAPAPGAVEICARHIHYSAVEPVWHRLMCRKICPRCVWLRRLLLTNATQPVFDATWTSLQNIWQKYPSLLFGLIFDMSEETPPVWIWQYTYIYVKLKRYEYDFLFDSPKAQDSQT